MEPAVITQAPAAMHFYCTNTAHDHRHGAQYDTLITDLVSASISHAIARRTTTSRTIQSQALHSCSTIVAASASANGRALSLPLYMLAQSE